MEKTRKFKLAESVKPINEKNVAKFVDELNAYCHREFDTDGTFFAKYGSLYHFIYRRFGDVPNKYLIIDEEGSLSMLSDKLVRPFIDKLAQKNGWYAEACTSLSDFCLDYL